MATEAWMNGPLDGYPPVVMPAAHALVQAIVDLEKAAADLSDEELLERPNGAPSIAFHLRHIAGSIDRLLTYSHGTGLTAEQFDYLKEEEAAGSDLSARELTKKAVNEIAKALAELKTAEIESLFEARYVGRQKLPTNVFGLLFHIAEHTARHVGQVVTTAKIVRGKSRMNVLAELQDWYQSYCNGTWEHSSGVKIETLDNPGWTIIIDLEETALENKMFSDFEDDKSEDDWIICEVKEKKFFGVGDPQKLEKIVGIFLEWVQN